MITMQTDAAFKQKNDLLFTTSRSEEKLNFKWWILKISKSKNKLEDIHNYNYLFKPCI